MEAIGEDLRAHGGTAHDADGGLPRLPRLHTVPRKASQHRGAASSGQDLMAGLAVQIAAAALGAPDVLASSSYLEAAEFAARAEDLARGVEYLQLLGAGAVHRTRTQAITHRAVTSPADDGCRNTAEFLRLRLRIPIREARRRLILAHQVLPATNLTGEPLPPPRPHLAAAITPTTNTDTGVPEPGHGPAVSSHAATIITATLDRLQHHATTQILDAIEDNLPKAACATDPDFLTRLAQRWTDIIDADGTEPTEEALRHTQGAFIRKPRHGLHHVEIFATTDQYEHLLTVMNSATNPRATARTAASPDSQDSSGRPDRTRPLAADNPTEHGARGHTPLPDLDRRTRAQKQLDGLVAAAKTALATNALPGTGGSRPQVIATIRYQDLFPANPDPSTAKDRSAKRGSGTFAFTGPIPAATLRKMACDADIIPALLGTTGEILDLGRKTRLFTPAQRNALTARDQGCTFPNCTIPAPWCEAHHITYWSRGGPTTTSNGTLLCSHHHHLIHKEQWAITTAASGTPAFIPPPHIDPTQTPQQNHYFKPPPPPRPRQ
ncbi:HNH endonuclease signature motif containing protein [Pseudarthrobacter sp. C4D7]|uniref:HNH endonuclease signature motif containing protein n=1 Tax=Pseudarthrobacter sp. C4D7 TaxID=2735268 RepID=UPI001585384E|nr:HNH endonuclease signature motif containing protein [Pseudarthrobacter sp. C4D7]NUT71119.1 DUF222 domain-containing protein [Pseudarthrobacter sp. C4D7]